MMYNFFAGLTRLKTSKKRGARFNVTKPPKKQGRNVHKLKSR